VTKIPDTLLDIAESQTAADLEAAFDEADRRRLTSLPALDRIIARSRGRNGLRPLRALVEERRRAPTRSELERRFLRFCHERELPEPTVNAPVAGLLVDCLWPAHRLIAELDGWAFHDGRVAFERDHMRSLALEARGYRVLRVTWAQLRDTPAAVEAALRRRLASSP
jgi:very-short-patch-repair endonuclease